MNLCIKGILVLLLCSFFTGANAEVYKPQMICPNDQTGWLPNELDGGRTSWPTSEEARAAGERYAQRMAQFSNLNGCKVNDVYMAISDSSTFISTTKSTQSEKKLLILRRY